MTTFSDPSYKKGRLSKLGDGIALGEIVIHPGDVIEIYLYNRWVKGYVEYNLWKEALFYEIGEEYHFRLEVGRMVRMMVQV
jgi:hypothetical protein